MKRIWMAVAAAVGLAVTAGGARADFGGPMAPAAPPVPAYGPGYGDPGSNTEDWYGLHPLLRKGLFWKKDTGCKTCGKGGGCGKGGCGPGGYGPYGAGMWNGQPGVGMPGTPGAAMPGTLVFPNHWYARSPRDYFMMDLPRP